MDNYEIISDSLGKKLPERENNYKWVAYLGLTIDRLIARIGKGWLDEALKEKHLSNNPSGNKQP